MSDVQTKRAPRPFGKKAIATGDFAAGTLASLQTGRRKTLFKKDCGVHNHTMIYGADNAVCTRCGFTCPLK